MTRIFDKMVKVTQKLLITVQGNPGPFAQKQTRKFSTFKPDAYSYYTEYSKSKNISYYDLAPPAEFNKHGGNAAIVDVSPASSCSFLP
jgi:hypothetical protein